MSGARFARYNQHVSRTVIPPAFRAAAVLVTMQDNVDWSVRTERCAYPKGPSWAVAQIPGLRTSFACPGI